MLRHDENTNPATHLVILPSFLMENVNSPPVIQNQVVSFIIRFINPDFSPRGFPCFRSLSAFLHLCCLKLSLPKKVENTVCKKMFPVPLSPVHQSNGNIRTTNRYVSGVFENYHITARLLSSSVIMLFPVEMENTEHSNTFTPATQAVIWVLDHQRFALNKCNILLLGKRLTVKRQIL